MVESEKTGASKAHLGKNGTGDQGMSGVDKRKNLPKKGEEKDYGAVRRPTREKARSKNETGGNRTSATTRTNKGGGDVLRGGQVLKSEEENPP